MNDLQYLFNLICSRRGVRLTNVESVPFNVIINFGLANSSEILPAVANTFYYIKSMSVSLNNAVNPTGIPLLRFTTYAGVGGSEGNKILALSQNVNVLTWWNIETDSVLYMSNTHTAGNFGIVGTVFKITYV